MTANDDTQPAVTLGPPMTRAEVEDAPPVPRYRLDVTITGNTLDEIERELAIVSNSWWVMDAHHPVTRELRDEHDITDGRSTRRLTHTNPDMTPDRYDAELHAWAQRQNHTRPEAQR